MLSPKDAAPNALPAKPLIKHEAGKYYLEALKCKDCDAVYLEERNVCSKCSARDNFAKVKLSENGKLYSFSIVYRSFPGIEVPYVSAIVDLEGGGTIKGNIINIEADPENIKFDMPLKVVFKDALGRKDAKGNSYVSYFFEPVL